MQTSLAISSMSGGFGFENDSRRSPESTDSRSQRQTICCVGSRGYEVLKTKPF